MFTVNFNLHHCRCKVFICCFSSNWEKNQWNDMRNDTFNFRTQRNFVFGIAARISRISISVLRPKPGTRNDRLIVFKWSWIPYYAHAPKGVNTFIWCHAFWGPRWQICRTPGKFTQFMQRQTKVFIDGMLEKSSLDSNQRHSIQDLLKFNSVAVLQLTSVDIHISHTVSTSKYLSEYWW